MAAAEFPRAFKLGSHRNSPPVWWLKEIVGWLEDKARLLSAVREFDRSTPIIPAS
jgi:predicted DNA-binding transcriptional regulator AlpA